MKNLILFGLLILLLVLVQFSSAQTADEIIDKYINARGGKDKLLSVKSILMEGRREMMGTEVQVKVIKEQDKLSRTEFEMSSTNGYLLVTDKEAFSFLPMRSPGPEKLSGQAAEALKTELDIAGPLVNYQAKGHKIEMMGKDSVAGNLCYKIKLTSRAGKEIIYWIDADSYLISQSSTKGVGSGKGADDEAIITLYKDYRPEEGILFPHTMETKSNAGRGGGGTSFEKIIINQPVNPKMYKPE